MYCGQCGTQNNEEAGHCETCGAPLLITAGARTCASCRSSLGDNDRFCPSCGASTEDAVLAGTYDATDDFGEMNIDDIEIADLPDWLQEMAPQAEAPPEILDPSEFEEAEPSAPTDLPEWLRDVTPGFEPEFEAPAPQPESTATGVDHEPADQFSLLSDDDLPDWLKALGDDEPETPVPQQSVPQQESRPANAVATLFDIPPVTRAWLAHGRQIDQSQVASAQQEFSPLEPVSSSGVPASPHRGIWDDEAMQPDDDSLEQTDDEAASEGRFPWMKDRMVRITTLVLLIVLVLILTVFLIQGM